MTRTSLSLLGGLALALASYGADIPSPVRPSARTLVLAHNAYPDQGKYADRLDRALAAGTPLVIEQDLVWAQGRSLMVHNAKFAADDSPTLDSYFFPRVKVVVEKALRDGNKGNWPLITLYLDIKNDPVEHLEAISKVLDQYDAWLTKAVKTDDITRVSPLELKPMMVIVEDKKNDIKQEFFYDRVTVGGKIRVFGSATKFDDNPTNLPRTARAERMALLLKIEPEQLVSHKADNYHRWFGADWNFIELCGPEHAKDWNAATEARVKKFVDYGHSLGYMVSFYSVNGFGEGENQGWTAEYNFGSREAAALRWKAAVKAHADFVGTDQYEELGKIVRPRH